MKPSLLPRLAALMLAPLPAPRAAEPTPDPGRYLEIVRTFADCMLEHGRDTYGKESSPLFAEALDRRTLRMLEGEALAKARALAFEEWGIRSHDRMLGGANPMHCQNLYQALYALTAVTGEARYGSEADRSLKYFFERCQSPATGLLHWGEHAGWDFQADAPLSGQPQFNTHEFFRPWALWEDGWRLAPEPCRDFAIGLWKHQIADHATADFSRHAAIDRHAPGTGAPYPRHGGFYIETWAFAYGKTRDATFLRAIETVADGLERMRRDGVMIGGGNLKSKPGYIARSESLAVSLWEASAAVPEPLAAKLKAIARANDAPGSGGARSIAKSTNLWSDGYGGFGGQIASRPNLLMLRHRQLPSETTRDEVLAAADVYLAAPVELSFPVHPGTFGKVVRLLLNAHELSGDARYLVRADELGREAIGLFLPDGSPLPKATHRHDHYEAITGADTLMASLLSLWAASQTPARKLPLVDTDR